MAWADPLVTVAAVVAGGAITYLVGRLSDRDRYGRELRLRWDQRRFDAYVAYVTAAKMAGATALAILEQRGDGAQKAIVTDQLGQLASLEVRRNEAFEALPLISDGLTVEAAHDLNHALWKLAQSARLGQQLNEAQLLALADGWVAALNDFHAAARASLSVVGAFSRRDVAALAVSRPERATTINRGSDNEKHYAAVDRDGSDVRLGANAAGDVGGALTDLPQQSRTDRGDGST